jgi:hypothetical protein
VVVVVRVGKERKEGRVDRRQGWYVVEWGRVEDGGGGSSWWWLLGLEKKERKEGRKEGSQG